MGDSIFWTQIIKKLTNKKKLKNKNWEKSKKILHDLFYFYIKKIFAIKQTINANIIIKNKPEGLLNILDLLK